MLDEVRQRKGWVDLRRNRKPMVYVLSSRSCADCRTFMESWKLLDPTSLSSLTSQFLAVLALDDYVLELGEDFQPPGADYLPRVFFADPDGRLRMEVTNPASADEAAPYYYSDAYEVVDVMRSFLRQHWEGLGTDIFPGDLTQDM